MCGWGPVLGLEPSAVLMGVVRTGRRGLWARGAAHKAVLLSGVTSHGTEQLRNRTKVDKLRLDLGQTLPSAPDTKCQLHRLLFLSLGKQTGAVRKNGPCKSKLSWLARE